MNKATSLAIEARSNAIKELNKNGAGYPERKLLVSKIQTPDGTILESRYRHDYVSHTDAISKNIFGLDGGVSYQRIIGNISELKNLSVYTDSPFEVIREEFTWGSYGVDGMQPKKITKLKDLSKDHIEAIIRTQVHLPNYIKDVFKSELEYRLINKE